jgi:hypothetical protein
MVHHHCRIRAAIVRTASGATGRIVHALFVARQLRRIFDYRRQVLGDIFGGSPTAR